jgi:diguanylate cyclase (GGDEF)-like protein
MRFGRFLKHGTGNCRAMLYLAALLWAFLPLHVSAKGGEETDSEPAQMPSPVFLHASLGGQPLTIDSEEVRKFPYNFNTLEVEFSVPGYSKESKLEYGIRLKGAEKDWYNSRLGEIRYPAIAPGSYLFEVRARVGSGTWSLPASLAFEIQPPWWFTRYAIAAWFFLIASAFFWRVQIWRIRARTLEKLISARTTALAMANADLERLSVTDPLTGLKNRRFVEFSITEDLARIQRSFSDTQEERRKLAEDGPNISFILIDIDYFKRVNDRYGHQAGDRVLRQMSAVFTSVIRESDTAVRWGGEEFLIIARSTQADDAVALAQRISGEVQSTEFAINDKETIRLTCSIGFAAWPFFRPEPDALGWKDVLALADRCLYLVKNSGRNAWIGVRTPTDYTGPADVESLNDFRSAEAKGVIRIQSSLSAGRKSQPFYNASRGSSTPQIYR